jgi:hypothetical protein
MIIKAPTKPLPSGYRPTGSQPYKVKDSDTWWTLSVKSGVDPWWLIQYNFETRDPGEVNWYLMNRVGCVNKTPNGKNFRFSSAAKPGIIYLPTPQMARSMTNRAFGKFGIAIEGDKDYQKRVELTLAWIAKSDTGLALLNTIKNTGKEITISPWKGTVCNATATPKNVRDATPAGYPVLMGGASFEQLMEPSLLRDLLGLPKEAVLGTGKGSDAVVNFSPSMFGYGASGACVGFAGAPGASPSQVLFHELAHAYRANRGVLHTRPTVGGSVNYTNMEEFFAVVLSNVLISDPTYSSGNRTLRADHAGFNPLSAALSTSRGFVSHAPNRNKMRELVASEPQLTKALKGVQSYFNPFAETL